MSRVSCGSERKSDSVADHGFWAERTASNGWADDEVDVGPLALGQETRITLCCGAAEDLPEFRIRIECRAEADSWTLLEALPPPRPPSGVNLS